jgi:drug/metabolite transporter (DMT)-like permease
LLLGERLGAVQWVGAAVVLVAVLGILLRPPPAIPAGLSRSASG